ncbi:MAG: 50S ribosomal protein L30 [archaeon]
MFVAIRIRGLKAVRVDIRAALDSLNLDRKHTCVFIDEKGKEGMLKKVKDYVAYGPVKKETVVQLIQKRGRRAGDLRISKEWLSTHKMVSVDALTDALISGKTTFSKLGMKPGFRLNSPKKGFEKGIKKPASLKGPLGFHAEGVDALLVQMM